VYHVPGEYPYQWYQCCGLGLRHSLTAPEPGEGVPIRTTTTLGTRKRARAYMLARMVVEIRSIDLAVEEEPYHELVPLASNTDNAHVFPRRTCVRVF
jgi:hypothetical protein